MDEKKWREIANNTENILKTTDNKSATLILIILLL